MKRSERIRRWTIVLAIAGLLAVAGRCEGEVDVDPEQSLGAALSSVR
jgi:hypothetical protein